MIINQSLNTPSTHKANFFNLVRNHLFNAYTSISQSLSKRLEHAQGAFQDVIELENKRRQRLNLKFSDIKIRERNPEGWLTDTSKSLAYPLYSGGNIIEDLELRLTQHSLFLGSKVYASNDIIEAGGKRYLIKLLPALYRNEGVPS